MIAALGFIMSSGCGGGKYGAGADTFDPEVGDDTSDTTTDATVGWTLGGVLEVAKGGVEPTQSSVTLHFVDAEGEVVCSEERVVTTAKPAAPPHVSVVAWWELDTVPPEPCTGGPPGALGLGVGALDPEIVARLGAVGLDGVEATLNGAYARLSPTGPLYVFGVAGLAGQFAGKVSAATSSPLADGTWQIVSVVPFPLDAYTR